MRVSGTEIRAPTGPSIHAQTSRERKTERVVRPTLLLMKRGAKTLSTMVFRTNITPTTRMALVKPDSSRVTVNGGISERMKPKLGMKLRTKNTRPHSRAKSTPKAIVDAGAGQSGQ